MGNQKRIDVLKSKLAIYANGLAKAKEKGNVTEICEWMEHMRNVRKEIASLQ